MLPVTKQNVGSLDINCKPFSGVNFSVLFDLTSYKLILVCSTFRGADTSFTEVNRSATCVQTYGQTEGQGDLDMSSP